MRPAPLFRLAVFAFVTAMAVPAHAEDKNDAQYKERMERLTASNPNAAGLEDKAQALYKSLSKEEMQKLVAMQSGIQMVRAVEFVRDDVRDTVKLCGKANPEMKAEMDAHFSDWEKKMMPLVADNQKRMDKAVGKDNFANPKEVKDFLDQLDKTAKFARERQAKDAVRVTSPQACKALTASMETSSGQLANALEHMRWPGEPPLASKAK